ncbi:MAG: sugar phosphate isomerase/epimerase [Lentisphaeria bacterium]|nr:sugar phosphate isomerase/epimerase [Lentisphaeria bacterium]
MAQIPIGLQLFSVRGECKKGIPETLRAVADMGYRGVEPWGYAGDAVAWMGWSAADLRKLLDDCGLPCCGIHMAPGALLGDNLARSIELNQILGNRFLIVAADKQRMSSMAGIEELAGILNRSAAILAPLGLACGYHAHGFDFTEVEGEQAWYHLFRRTAPEVIMQLDVGNCAGGGGDPVRVLKTFPGRARSVHLKDYGKPGGVIGEGSADWPEIFRLCDTAQPVEWYVVEEGGPDGLGFDVCARSLAALKRMGRC